MKNGVVWFLVVYLKILLAAVFLACLSYELVQGLVQVLSWNWLNYLARKPLCQYVDRWRLVCALFAIPILMRHLKMSWYQWNFRFRLDIYVINFFGGIALWLVILGFIIWGTQGLVLNSEARVPYIAIFFASLTIALLEELIFRGFIFEVLKRKHSVKFSRIALGIIFALLHFSVCYSKESSSNILFQGFQCAYHSIVDTFGRIQWPYFFCLFFLNGILVNLRQIHRSLWACIGFHQGLVFILMLLRKQYLFNPLQNCFWGTGRLTDSWCVVLILCVIYKCMTHYAQGEYEKI